MEIDFLHIPEGLDLNKLFYDEAVPLSEKEFAIRFYKVTVRKKGLDFEGKLYMPAFLSSLSRLGYAKRPVPGGKYCFIREKDNIITEVTPSEIKDDFYRQEFSNIQPLVVEELEISAEKQRDTYLKQAHLIFNSAFLEHLPTHDTPVLKDSRTEMFFPFRNVVLRVSSNEISQLQYGELEGVCVWEDHIIGHEIPGPLNNVSNGHFAQFIKNVCSNAEDRYKALCSSIGYLLHNFSEPSKGQAVIFYDEKPAERGQPEGGTGKGLVANSIKQLRNVAKIDGKKFDSNDRFRWQSVTPKTQIVEIDDVTSKFDFEVLHSCLTDGMNVERKYLDEFFIKPEDSPKFLIASNTILTNQGATNKRRQFIIEFSDHYSKHIKNGTEEPIRDEHGCMFFSEDWDQDEWVKFLGFMVQCAQSYLKHGLVPYTFKNLMHNQLLQNTSDDFAAWFADQLFIPGEWYVNDDLFDDFIGIYQGFGSDFSQRGFTTWLKRAAGIHGWKLEIKRSNNKSMIRFNE